MGTTNLDWLEVAGVPTFGMADIPLGGSYFVVDSATGSNGNDGSYSSPLATIAYAIGKCTANKGDVIIVKAGHAETLTAAAAIACNVAGVSIIGCGVGSDRPELTFSTATTASIVISAASTRIRNIIGIAGINALVNPIHVQAANCEVDIEWQDGSSSVEAARVVLGTAAADKLKLKIKHIGFPAGSAGVNCVRLVGSNDVHLDIDYYGKASTSVVEFLTTACTNVNVFGYMYNSGTTNGSKNVVDTVTGSTWYAEIKDGAAGQTYSGGSGAALASDDVSAVVANQAVPSADSTANALERDATGNKTDAAVYVPGTTKSSIAYSKGTADLQERVVKKAAAVLTNGLTLFTVAGGPIEVVALTSICETANDATASTLQYSATPTSGSAQTVSGASASLASAAAGASVTLAGTALATAALLNANGPNLIANPGTIMVPAGTITAVIGTGSTTGTWAHYLRYRPLATGVTVT